uniref:LolE permease component of an ABC-transporter system n=1 Tax=uncultured bacterium CSLF42 TaxID=1091574 RepID=G4WVX2_9BACT|nr:LolE permease component of an ABC-transporter system [uncultured bacterium CSLF42]
MSFLSLKLALRNLSRNRMRSGITLLVIGSGSIAMIIAGGFIEDTVRQVRESSIRDLLGHLRVYKRGYLENGVLKPYDYMILDPSSLAQRLSAHPYVVNVGPRLTYFGLIGNGDITMPFIMQAFDPALESRLRNTTAMKMGHFIEPNKPYDVLLGEGLAKALNLKMGDSPVLVGNTQHGAMNASDVNVVGVFQTLSKDFDDSGIRAPIQLAQKLLRVDGAQMLVLFLDRTEHTEAVKRWLQALFARENLDYEVQAWYELPDAAFVSTTENVYRSIYKVIKIVLFLFVILSIMNTMNMAVLERVGEIGTLMALGTPRRGIWRLFLAEGIIMGLLGGALGCSVGCLLARVISWIGIVMPNPPGTQVQWIARIRVTPGIVASAFTMAFATSLISSVLPALKASKLEIAEALRHNV